MTLQDAINKFYIPTDPNAILNWDVFDEDIVVTGAKGTGKSTLVNQDIVEKLVGVPLWILDPKKRFSNCGVIVNDISLLKRDFQYVLQPKENSEPTFIAFCEKLLKESDIHFIIDEIHLWLSKQNKIKAHYDLVMTKRNDGVTGTSISTDTKAIPNYLLKNVTHVYSLRYNLPDDIDWLARYIGEKAQFLLTPDKRDEIDTGFKFEDGRTITFKDMPMLKEYSYVYRDLRNEDGAIIGGFKEPSESIAETPTEETVDSKPQEQLAEIKIENKGDDQVNVDTQTNEDDKIDSKIL